MTNMNIRTSGSRPVKTHIQSVSHEYEIEVILFDDEDNEIPATIGVTHFVCQPPLSYADNPDDYYGYVELEYDVFDEDGYKDDSLNAYVSSSVEDYVIEQCEGIAKSEAEDRAYDDYVAQQDYEYFSARF